MGLEMVDIVLRTERTFCIEISDEDASEIVTVGDYQKLILRYLREAGRLGAHSGMKCLSSAWL